MPAMRRTSRREGFPSDPETSTAMVLRLSSRMPSATARLTSFLRKRKSVGESAIFWASWLPSIPMREAKIRQYPLPGNPRGVGAPDARTSKREAATAMSLPVPVDDGAALDPGRPPRHGRGLSMSQA
jgi:hypothetical protein